MENTFEQPKTISAFYSIGLYTKDIANSILFPATKYLRNQKTKTLRPAIILVLKTSF